MVDIKEQLEGRNKLLTKLNTTEERLKEDVSNLKLWMSRQPHLKCTAHFDLEFWIENQLIMAKNSLEKTKNSIDRYYRARTMCPQLFQKRDVLDDAFQESFETLTVSYLPGLTSRLNKVCVVRVESSLSENFNFETHMKRGLMVMEYYLKVGLDFTGFHVIIDLKNFKLNHLASFNISSMKAMSIAMIILVKDLESLKSEIDDVELPKDYGGNCELTQCEYNEIMKNNLLSVRDYILNCDSIEVPEEVPVLNKRCNTEPEIDMNGSFRMLSID